MTLVGLACCGCDESEEPVRSYRVPKESRPVAESSSSDVPPPPPVAAAAIEWDLPDGWRREENTSAFRFATLSAGEGDQRIEVSISQLSGQAGGAMANINRWRGQIGLGPAGGDDMHDALEEITGRGVRGLLVDMVGTPAEDGPDVPRRMLAAMYATTERTWFIKTVAPDPVIASHREAFLALCSSIRIAGAAAPSAPSTGGRMHAAREPDGASSGLKWDLPDGWQQDARPATMAMASFTIAEGDQKAAVTITPLGAKMPLLGNIERWRVQAGLKPAGSLEAAAPTKIEVAGQEAYYVDLPGPKQHILGVMAERGSRTWFYKVTGPDPLVAKQKGAFEAFVRSIRFDENADE